MIGIEFTGLAAGATVALAAGAGVLVFISYWWNNDRRKQQFRSSGAGVSSTIVPKRNGIKYDLYKLSNNGQNSSVNETTTLQVSKGLGESKYVQIIQDLQTRLEDERSKREAVELRCQKYEREVESLTIEHNALQDSHEKLLKQYNNMSHRLKIREERNIQVRDALNTVDIPREITDILCLDNEEEDIDMDIQTSVKDTEDDSMEILGDDSDAESLDSGAQSESETSREIDFELTENVMHALISRESVAELLHCSSPLEHDDLADLVEPNQLDDDEEEDIDDLVSNNSQYSLEEEEDEERRRKQEENNNNDVNEEHLRGVKTVLQMFENRIKGSESPTVTPPRRFGSRASSNRSSLVGSRNHSDSDGEADDILANSDRPDISELMRQFETPERQDSKKTVEIQITESTSDNDISQAS